MFGKPVKKVRFTFVCTSQERWLISAIAKRMLRSQGDAVRFLLYRAADDMGIGDETSASVNGNSPQKISN